MSEHDQDADVRDILAVRAGDAQRFRGLVERHGPRVHDLARRLLRDVELAEDIAQQAFTNAWRALTRFDLERPFRHWILRITTNLCRNAHAARRVRPERASGGIEEPSWDPPGRADAAEPSRPPAHVREAIERLPERYRLPVVLHHLHGLSLEAIAEITELPVATLKTHLNRGRAALRDLLRPPETGGTALGTPPRTPSSP